jgi:site-specific recombinase XerD
MNQNVKIVFDRKKQVETTGIGKIEIYIYLARKEKKYEVVGEADINTWEAIALNKNIQAKMKHYEQVINAMKMLNEEMTIENFNEHVFTEEHPKRPDETHLYNGHDQRQSFVDFCRNHLEQENLAKNSIKGFNVVFDSVEASGILNTLADLTTANVVAYDAYLRRQKDKSDYTIHGYHKKVGKYCRLLWQLEMISSNPYDHVKFPKGSNKERNPLNEAELLKIRNAKLTGYLGHTRDLFIFMAYTGLAYCDMALFDYNTMTEERKDYIYIDGSRLKTGSKFFTPILPPAMEVLKKYDYKLPIITNQKINMYSHVIEAQLNIKKPVTCHIARHSFATLMLSYGFSLETVKKMLGHKDIRTTQIYAKLSKEVVEDGVTKKLKRLK